MEVLKRKRSTIKASLTRIESWLQTTNEIGSQYTAVDFQCRFERLTNLFNEYEEVQQGIENLIQEEGLLDEEITYRTEIENKYYRLYAELKPRSTSVSNSPSASLSGEINIHFQTKLQLPSIQIPVFNGQYQDWPSFFDLFNSIVHSNHHLTSVQKLQYLKMSVKDEAASVLKNLQITDANYEVALDTLKQRYDKADFISELHLQAMMETQQVAYPSVEALKTIYSVFDENVRALNARGLPTEHWDCWLNYIVVSKLDAESQQLWRRQCSSISNPTFTSLLDFLDKRIFELSGVPKAITTHKQDAISSIKQTNLSLLRCVLCRKGHYIFSCSQYLALSVKERKKFVTGQGLCFNCVKGKHLLRDCKSQSRCQQCNQKHHTTLHSGEQDGRRSNHSIAIQGVPRHTRSSPADTIHVLPTMVVRVQDSQNRSQLCRALLDSGSEVTLISENCVQRLNLNRKASAITISSIGEKIDNYSRGEVQLTLTSRFAKDISFNTTAYILPKLTRQLPAQRIPVSAIKRFKSLSNLADEHFDQPAKLDMIIGCDIFFEIISDEKFSDENSCLKAINTSFGWIVAGEVTTSMTKNCLFATMSLENSLRHFWELEELEPNQVLTPEEIECEQYFDSTYSRLANGRFVVRLPIKNSLDRLGESRYNALRRLQNIERRFTKDKEFDLRYHQFMEEYVALEHMQLAITDSKNLVVQEDYYLPHHGVWKDSSTTTKLRVVFDGSCKSSSGLALNDRLHTGPKLHNNLYDILLRFRLRKIGYVADIKKMFRQILINEKDRHLQKILWRNSAKDEAKTYELNTVTYGTACAPYLAIKTLLQLCKDNTNGYDRATKSVTNHFYVDDLLASADSPEEARLFISELIRLLEQGKFELHKWASNSKDVLEYVYKEQKISIEQKVNINEKDNCIKILGLNWFTKEDKLAFTRQGILSSTEIYTKRKVLSLVAKFFDPIGLLAPVIIKAKLLIQELWKEGKGWDTPLSPNLSIIWTNILHQFASLEQLRIDRWVRMKGHIKLELHCFSDASEKAYGAAIYVRIWEKTRYVVNLLTASSKVAPIKQVSLPRLELCGAYLLVKLLKRVISALTPESIEIYAWTDSTIVLAWLNDFPRRWSCFVGNRTAIILETIPANRWRHVNSSNNPADIISRGIFPKELINLELWWHGPNFLQDNDWTHVSMPKLQNINLERRKQNYVIQTNCHNDCLLDRFSSLTKLLRISAWILRFIRKCKGGGDPVVEATEYLTTGELDQALSLWVKYEQKLAFKTEYHSLSRNMKTLIGSKLCSLEPFLDTCNIMRVGGRLSHSNVNFDHQHPIILDKTNKLSRMIVHHYHHKLLHATGRLLETTIRLKFWIVGVKQLIKSIVTECVICTRYRAEACKQKMGELPSERVTMAKPFSNCGVDYAGPYTVRTWKGRGAKKEKIYICLFICMATKAIHLELVIGLTSESFIAAFKRFVARRGAVKTLFSDNGTNFHGALRHIKEAYQYFSDKFHRHPIYSYLTENQINWKFIPPGGPHFGGIWEAGIKSVKFYLKRVLIKTYLTFEEVHTLLCQIELQLNSRPLIPLSGNKEDIDVLTPGHFLTGAPLMGVPEIIPEEDIKCLRSRWKVVQHLQQSFWKRWHRDYLTTLHQRSKWLKEKRNLQIDDLVLVIDQNLPPGSWLTGRIVEVHPGKDDLVRVVTLKTKNGILKRPITKLCLLLPQDLTF